MHGLIIGLVGASLVVLWVHGATLAFELALALLVLSCGLFGGWLWRYRHAQDSVAL